MQFLGIARYVAPMETYNIISNRRIEKVADFRGSSVAIGWVFKPFLVDFLGVLPVSIPDGERYTALERGVVDGSFVKGAIEVVPRGYQEVTKYFIDEKFGSNNTSLVMNLNKFKSLPVNLQNVLMDSIPAMEPYWEETYQRDEAAARKTMTDAGVEFLKFSPEEHQKIVNGFISAEWGAILENFPTIGPQFKALLMP